MALTLAELRNRIDALDLELLALLNRRAGLAHEVGELKKGEGSVVFRPEREAQVIATLQQANAQSGLAHTLQSDSVAFVWREIMSACRALEAPQRVAYLGPAGTLYGTDAPRGGYWNTQVLNRYWATVGGGTSEVHRNMIAERALGLPREAQIVPPTI